MNPEREENKVLIAATDNVIQFPSPEAWAERKKENEEKRAAGIKRVNDLIPYFRIWIKRTIGRDAKDAYREGGKWTASYKISWFLENLINHAESIAFFQKQMRLEKIEPPEMPTDVTSWEVMKGFTQAIRRYNFGMMKGASGYTIQCEPDHKVVQTISTGEYVWSEPTELKFELWRVANGDYEQPWKLEWIQHPDDPSKRIQQKVFIKTQSVLKPWSDKKEPELEVEDSRTFQILALKEGDSVEIKLQGDHASEAQLDLDDLQGLVTRISESNNVRFDMRCPDEWHVILTHTGKLYR